MKKERAESRWWNMRRRVSERERAQLVGIDFKLFLCNKYAKEIGDTLQTQQTLLDRMAMITS